MQIALRTQAFPTRVDMCIVTNRPQRMQTLLDSWCMPHVRVCGTNNTLDSREQYALLWEHREVMKQAHQEGVSPCNDFGCTAWLSHEHHMLGITSNSSNEWMSDE
jgi:hypothetical protein